MVAPKTTIIGGQASCAAFSLKLEKTVIPSIDKTTFFIFVCLQ